MRKDAFNFTLTVFVLGIFGFFLRWLQNMNAFEADTGLAIAGAKSSLAFVLFSVAAAVLLVLADRFYLGRRVMLYRKGEKALRCTTALHKAVLWVLAVAAALCCLVLMFSADAARFPTLRRIVAALGILSAALLPLVFPGRKPAALEAEEKEAGASLAGIAAIIPILFSCMWLLDAYISDAENPVRWQYIVYALAVVALTMGFYYMGAYFYNRAKPWRCLPIAQLAAYLCLCTLADSHAAAMKFLLAAMAGVMLVLQFVIIENAVPRTEEKEETQEETPDAAESE